MLGLCKEGSWSFQAPPRVRLAHALLWLRAAVSLPRLGFGPVNTAELRPVVAGAGDHTVPVTHSPQGASLLVGKGRGPRETGAGMAGCTGRGRGMGNKEFKLGLPN